MNLPIPGNMAVWLLGAVLAAYLLSYFLWRGKRRLSYADKLRDPRWRSLRRQVLELHHNRCALCGGKAWQVHHQFYISGAEPWNYDIEALTPLCGRCHSAYEAGKKLNQH